MLYYLLRVPQILKKPQTRNMPSRATLAFESYVVQVLRQNRHQG